MLVQNIQKINIERVLKVLLVMCVILALSLSWFAPQANAVLGTATLIAGASVSAEVIGSVIAALVMAATGVCFDNGFFGDTDNLSTMAYEQGYKLVQDMIISGGNVASWLDNAIALYTLSGGFKSGDQIEVPAEVLEFARTWVNENYDFSGDVTITSDGIISDTGDVFLLSDVSSTDISSIGNAIKIVNYTTSDYSTPTSFSIVNIGGISFQTYAYIHINQSSQRYQSQYKISCNMYQGEIVDNFYSVVSGGGYMDKYSKPLQFEADALENFNDRILSNYAILGYDSVNNRLVAGYYNSFTGEVVYSSTHHYYDLANADNFVSATSSLTGTDALSVPQTENVVITVPTPSMGDIGGYTVPILPTLTPEMVVGDVVYPENPDIPDTPDTNLDWQEPEFTVPDTWAGIDAWFKYQAQNFRDYTAEVQAKLQNAALGIEALKTLGLEWINEKWKSFEEFVKTLPQEIALKFEGIIADVLEAVNNPIEKIKDKFNETKNKLLPFIQNGFGFPNIWHYVVSWVGSLGSWLRTLFTVWNGLPYEMVVPIYATAVIVIVIGMYRRFFM